MSPTLADVPPRHVGLVIGMQNFPIARDCGAGPISTECGGQPIGDAFTKSLSSLLALKKCLG